MNGWQIVLLSSTAIRNTQMLLSKLRRKIIQGFKDFLIRISIKLFTFLLIVTLKAMVRAMTPIVLLRLILRLVKVSRKIFSIFKMPTWISDLPVVLKVRVYLKTVGVGLLQRNTPRIFQVVYLRLQKIVKALMFLVRKA